MAVLLPVTAQQLSVGLWKALLLEGGVVAFFIAHTYAFTWAFDRIFDLPASAR